MRRRFPTPNASDTNTLKRRINNNHISHRPVRPRWCGIEVTEERRRTGLNAIVVFTLVASVIWCSCGLYLSFLDHSQISLWIVAAPSLLSAGTVVFTYGVGGLLAHGPSLGWAFFQPFRGGKRFAWLQVASWVTLGISLFVPWLKGVLSLVGDGNASSTIHVMQKYLMSYSAPFVAISSAFGMLSQVLTIVSLFAYQPPRQQFTWRFLLTHKPDSLAYLYIFMSTQTALAILGLLLIIAFEHLQDILVGSVVFFAFALILTVSIMLTHGVGGPWLHQDTSFTAFQPGRGGIKFIVMQIVGWTSFTLVLVVGLSRCALVFYELWEGRDEFPRTAFQYGAKLLLPGALPLGLVGVFAQIVLTLSLIVFEESELEIAQRYWKTARKNERRAWRECCTGLPEDVQMLVEEFI